LVKAGVRLIVAGLLLAPFALRSLRRAPPSRDELRHTVKAGALGGVFYGIHFGAWVWSIDLTTVAASVTLVTSTPLMLAMVALVTGRDRPSRGLWLAVCLAGIGMLIIGGSDWRLSPEALAGDGLALLGAAGMAAYLLLGRRLGRRLNVWVFSACATAVGGTLLLLSAVLAGIHPLPSSWAALGFLVAAAALPQLVGHTLLTWSLRHTRPTVVGMATVGEPVGSTFLAWIWLGETVAGTVAVGCLITLSAVLVALALTDSVDSAPEDAHSDGGGTP